jgi:hypothetical protein
LKKQIKLKIDVSNQPTNKNKTQTLEQKSDRYYYYYSKNTPESKEKK